MDGSTTPLAGASLVIEHFDVVEQGRLRVAAAGKAIRQFALHRREEALIGPVLAPWMQQAVRDVAVAKWRLEYAAIYASRLLKKREIEGFGTAIRDRYIY